MALFGRVQGSDLERALFLLVKIFACFFRQPECVFRLPEMRFKDEFSIYF